MTPLTGVEQVAWYLGIGLCVAVLLRVWALDVASRYPAFVAFLAISAVRSIMLASVPFNSNVYGWMYILGTPLLYGVYAWLVAEVYGHAFESYQGNAAFGRWTILGVLLAGAALAVTSTLWSHDASREPFPILGLVFGLESVVTKTLLAFLLLICAVLAWFPIPQRPNLLLIGFGATAFLTSSAASLVARGLNPTAWIRIASASVLYVFAACMGLWLFGLRSRARDVTAARPLPAMNGGEAALAGALRSMNQALESLRKAG
jgi:hypothetical protein